MSKINSKKQMAYETIKKLIINNTLGQGELVSEAELANELKISKTPIREALQQLESEGLIKNIPRKGTFVANITLDDIREIYEIREIIECGTVRLAAMRADISELEKIGKEYHQIVEDNDSDPENLLWVGEKLHGFIFESLNNKRLSALHRNLQDNIDRLRLYFVNRSGQERLKESHVEHLEIIDALLARDHDRAEKAMRTHINNAINHIKSLI